MLVTKIPVLTILLVNKLLKKLLPKFTKWEKLYSTTSYFGSLGVKLTIVMFLNTDILLLLSYIFNGNIYGTPSLIEEISDLLIVAFIFPSLDNLFTALCCSRLRRNREKQRLNKGMSRKNQI